MVEAIFACPSIDRLTTLRGIAGDRIPRRPIFSIRNPQFLILPSVFLILALVGTAKGRARANAGNCKSWQE